MSAILSEWMTKLTLVIDERRDDHKTIAIRPSMIDMFNRCPRQYKHNKFIDTVNNAFEFWKKIHSCVLPYLVNKNPDRVQDLCKIYWDDMYRYLHESNAFPDLLTIEKRYSIEIECGDIVFDLSGSTDWVTTSLWLFDLKTASAKRVDGRSRNTMQFKLYSYMFARELWLEYVERNTGVLIKWKKPRHQIQKEFFDVSEIEQEIKNTMEDLAHYYREDTWEPIENKMCFTCWVKSDCPIHTKLFKF